MSKKHNLLHKALADDNLAIDIKFKNALRERILNTKENTTMAEKKHQTEIKV